MAVVFCWVVNLKDNSVGGILFYPGHCFCCTEPEQSEIFRSTEGDYKFAVAGHTAHQLQVACNPKALIVPVAVDCRLV